MSFLNVAAHLPALAQQQPDALAVVDSRRGSRYTFRQLDDASSDYARQLQSIGIDRGVRTVLMAPPSLEFFALTFALFKLSAVPVLIDPGMGVRNLGKCLAEAEPEAFIGVPKAHFARRLLAWGRKTIRTTVAVRWPRLGCTHSIKRKTNVESFPVADVTADEMAAILFTSGSTGIAKGVVYTHGIFSAQVEAIREAFAIKPGEIDLATFPLFALFGPALGMTAIIPDMNPTRPARVDPARIFSAISDFNVTNLFGSPALLNRLCRAGNGQVLSSVRRVISAGAPVSAAVVERFTRLLPPGTQVFTPYGATEALPVAVIGSDEILKDTRYQTEQGAGVCVGKPVPGVSVKIIRICDEAIPQWSEDLELPAGEIGEIAVSGPWVTASYYNRPEATMLAKIAAPSPTGFCHRMGDVGYFDVARRLWFCGRKTHRVVLPDATLFTIPCEAIFNTHPAVFRSALVGITRDGVTVPVMCIEREPGAKITDQHLRTELLELGAAHAHTSRIRAILFHRSFPVDIRHNAKIFREKLAVWAERRAR